MPPKLSKTAIYLAKSSGVPARHKDTLPVEAATWARSRQAKDASGQAGRKRKSRTQCSGSNSLVRQLRPED